MKDTAITISLLITGSWLTFSTSLLVFLPRLKMPIEEKVPSIVLTTADTVAIRKVLPIARHNSGALSLVNIDAYASRLNPFEKLNKLVLKNENRIMQKIGAYKTNKTTARYIQLTVFAKFFFTRYSSLCYSYCRR